MSKLDICDRLRLAPANLIGTDDEERYWVCHDAAREIERLRLTDEEREALEVLRDGDWERIDRKTYEQITAAISGLLARDGGE
jgi:hypothetical protein